MSSTRAHTVFYGRSAIINKPNICLFRTETLVTRRFGLDICTVFTKYNNSWSMFTWVIMLSHIFGCASLYIWRYITGALPERRCKSNNKEKVLDVSWFDCIGYLFYYLYRFRTYTSHDIQEYFRSIWVHPIFLVRFVLLNP
jgi:hypothetical protein